MSLDLESAQTIARVLTEALPYIQRFTGKTIVVKFGGNAMVDPQLHESFARDVVLMKLVGMNPVVVHGGGPQIGELLKKLNIHTEFVNGMEMQEVVGSDAIREVLVEEVLGGQLERKFRPARSDRLV